MGDPLRAREVHLAAQNAHNAAAIEAAANGHKGVAERGQPLRGCPSPRLIWRCRGGLACCTHEPLWKKGHRGALGCAGTMDGVCTAVSLGFERRLVA
jgi:hypothetical protein